MTLSQLESLVASIEKCDANDLDVAESITRDALAKALVAERARRASHDYRPLGNAPIGGQVSPAKSRTIVHSLRSSRTRQFGQSRIIGLFENSMASNG
jgi:hypothetical protein